MPPPRFGSMPLVIRRGMPTRLLRCSATPRRKASTRPMYNSAALDSMGAALEGRPRPAIEGCGILQRGADRGHGPFPSASACGSCGSAQGRVPHGRGHRRSRLHGHFAYRSRRPPTYPDRHRIQAAPRRFIVLCAARWRGTGLSPPTRPSGACRRLRRSCGQARRTADSGALHQRLVMLGDLPADAAAPSEPLVYEGVWIEGVRHFQIRHGLEPDGVLGKSTQAALSVPHRHTRPADRARARAATVASTPRRQAVRRREHSNVPPLGLGLDST